MLHVPTWENTLVFRLDALRAVWPSPTLRRAQGAAQLGVRERLDRFSKCRKTSKLMVLSTVKAILFDLDDTLILEKPVAH